MQGQHRHKALAEFKRLPPEMQRHVRLVVPLFAARHKQSGRKHAPRFDIWIRDGGYREFTPPKVSEAPADMVWIADRSDAARALAFVRNLTSAISPLVRAGPDGSRGYYVRKAPGADLLAMLAFADQSQREWLEFERGTPQCAAWQTRFVEWTGKPRPFGRPRAIEGVPLDLKAPDVIRVPCPWPPKKDGTLYMPGHGPPASLMTDDDWNAFAEEGR